MAAFHANGSHEGGRDRRDPKDRYETPDEVLDALASFPELGLGSQDLAVDPCCGTGRLVRRMKSYGWTATGTDIEEDGLDFLSDGYTPSRAGWTAAGNVACVTNPPFSHAEAFVRRALALFDGPVAMLLPADFMWSQSRRGWLSADGRPLHQLIVPWRIRFLKRDGTRIAGQAYSHQWLVWPAAGLRPSERTLTDWCPLAPYLDAKAARGTRASVPAGPAHDSVVIKDEEDDETWLR